MAVLPLLLLLLGRVAPGAAWRTCPLQLAHALLLRSGHHLGARLPGDEGNADRRRRDRDHERSGVAPGEVLEYSWRLARPARRRGRRSAVADTRTQAPQLFHAQPQGARVWRAGAWCAEKTMLLLACGLPDTSTRPDSLVPDSLPRALEGVNLTALCEQPETSRN